MALNLEWMDHPPLASDRLHYVLCVQTLSGSWIVLTHLELVGCAEGVLWFIHVLLWQTELWDYPLISPRLPGLTPQFPLMPPANAAPTAAHRSHTCSSLVKTNGGGDLSHAKECRHAALTCVSDVTRHKLQPFNQWLSAVKGDGSPKYGTSKSAAAKDNRTWVRNFKIPENKRSHIQKATVNI